MQNVADARRVPRPASSVMLVRDDAEGALVVYLLRRSSRSRFVPDAYVFPGGTVDPEDCRADNLTLVFGEVCGCSREFAAAALRELLEEAGVLLACSPAGKCTTTSATLRAHLRSRLAGRSQFWSALARHDLRLDARELTYYSNWITPETEPLRFDVHFFIARAPEGQEPVADAIEVHDGRWLAPSDALARADRGELAIIFPTRKHLERLAGFASVDELLAHARSARRIAPVLAHQREDGEFALRPGQEAW